MVDIILTSDHEEEIGWENNTLAKEFEIKDIRMLKHFLGMKITRSREGISISQQKYTLDLLKETCMLSKPSYIPTDLPTNSI